jgi:hypothetical protein
MILYFKMRVGFSTYGEWNFMLEVCIMKVTFGRAATEGRQLTTIVKFETKRRRGGGGVQVSTEVLFY